MPVSFPASFSALQPDEIAAHLPDEALHFLLRDIPARVLWQWLSDDERATLRQDLTRGFQRTIQALRQPIVRKRLVEEMRRHHETFQALLDLWKQGAPLPNVIKEIRALADDAQLIAELAAMRARYGNEALMLSLLAQERNAALEAFQSLQENPIEGAPQNTDSSDKTQLSTELLSTQQKALEQAKQETQKERAAKTTWRDAAHEAQKKLKNFEARAQQETQNLQLRAKQHERRVQVLESEAEETIKRLDRATRKWKQSETSLEELQAENKRLKRQVRQAQQMHEDLRKQLAGAQARLRQAEAQLSTTIQQSQKPIAANSEKTATSKTPIPAIVAEEMSTVALLAQPFHWMADGRAFRVVPREVKSFIDRNDEEWVFNLIQGLEVLQETHPRVHKQFIECVRQIGRYYHRVLKVETTRVLIDASNVVRHAADMRGKGKLSNLLLLRDELRRLDCFPIKIVSTLR